MNLTFNARLSDFLNAPELLKLCGFEPGGPVQHAINEAVLAYCNGDDTGAGYLPASPDRYLSRSGVTDDEAGWVAWNTPYARYLYYGFVMTDELGRTWVGEGETKPIIHKDRPLQFDRAQNTLAGPHWFERMIADRKQDVLDMAAAAIPRR